MQTYQFETKILPNGIIPLPKEYKSLKSHMVKIIIIEKEKKEKTLSEETKLFWDSFGSWKDERDEEEIVKDIYETRKSSKGEIRL
ncbi:MAG: hypothetical protein AB1422_15615 [bacterium]